MVKCLDRKLLRDLAQLKGQIITICLVVGAGVACLVSSLSTYYSLKRAESEFYQRSRFAEIFVDLKRAPESIASRISRISGVAQLETRIVFDAILDIPYNTEPATARLISIPDGKQPVMNQLYLRRGRFLDLHRMDEILVSEGFAEANQLKPGDSLRAILNGRLQMLHITGIVLSPEYVYALRGQNPLPDDRYFAVIWMNKTALAAAFNMSGAFNSATLTLSPGANERFVKESVDRLLLQYGSIRSYDRKQQSSYRYLSDEINQQRVMAVGLPVIFLGVAMFLLNVVIGRLVGTQRQQIATLKAVGYADRAIAIHYLKLVAIIVFLGTIVGIVLGSALGRMITANYQNYFRFPALPYRFSPFLGIVGFVVSLGSGALGALGAILHVVKLQPAEAMRPPPPLNYKAGVLERFAAIQHLSPEWKMGIRNVSRRPARTFLTGFGISLAVGIVIVGVFWRDTLDALIRFQFFEAQRGEIELAFADPESVQVLPELLRIPGVLSVEGTRAVPIQIRHEHYTYDVGMFGLPDLPVLRRLLNSDYKVISLPPEGVLVSSGVAERLHLIPGDVVEIEIRELNRPQFRMEVAGLVNDLVGSSVYLRADRINRLLGEAPSVSNATLLIDPSRSGQIYRRLKELPKIDSIAMKSTMIRSFRKTMGQIVLVYSAILTAFATAISIGVVYNSARIAFSERAWELASLRVLGFTRAEIARLLLGELGFEILISIPPGFVLGYLLSLLAITLLHTENFDFPLIITAQSYCIAALAVSISGALAALIVRKKLDRLDLVSVLKARE